MFFETIYRWFAGLFGADMADYLSGYVCETEFQDGGYLGTNEFAIYGWIALGIAFAVAAFFYFFNHPQFNKLRNWLIMVLLVGAANLIIAVSRLWGVWFYEGEADCLINGNNGGIYANNVIGFGFANLIVSSLFFIIISIVVFNLLIGRFAIHNTCNTPINFHKNK